MKRSGWRVATIPTLCSLMVCPPIGGPAHAFVQPNSTAQPGPSVPAPSTSDEAPPPEPPSACKSWAADPAVLTPAPSSCNKALAGIMQNNRQLDRHSENRVPKSGRKLHAFSGSHGHTSTKTFKVSGKWKVKWESDSDFMAIALREEVGGQEKVTPLQNMKSPGKNSRQFESTGTYYLDIEADGPWRVRIMEIVEGYSYDYDVNASTVLTNPFSFPVNLEYSFGEGKVKKIKLTPGQELKIYGTAALMDFSEPRDLQALGEEFPPPVVYEVTSASHLATNARRKAEREKKLGKQDPFGKERKEASTELQRSAISERDRAERKKLEKLEKETRLSRKADRDWVRRWSMAGAISLVVGLGGGAALISIGTVRKKTAQGKFKDTQDIIKIKGTTPLRQSALGRYANDAQTGRALVTGGIILAVSGALLGTGMFIAASRKPSTRLKKTSDTYVWSAAPYWSAQQKSLGFTGQLRF